MFHYTLNDDGYLQAVFFGCITEGCSVYEGEIPDDLEENLGAYRFGRGGNLLKAVGFKHKCILSSNGEEIENQDANLVVTDYIELMENREYIYKNVATSGLYGAFYDEEYNLKNAFLIDSGSNEVELTIPEGARYVRFTADLSNNKYCLRKINIGDDLSDKTLYGYNFEQVTGRTDDAPTSEYKHILIQTDNYYLLAYNNGSDKRYIQVYDKRDASPSYSRPKLYDANENINEFPCILPDDFGTVKELRTVNPYYDFLFIDNPEEETVFTFFSTNELILDEAKLEEIQNNIPYDYSTSEVFTGKYWINGEPIYRKAVTGTTLSYSGDLILISNADRIIDHTIYIKRSGLEQWHLISGLMADSPHVSPLYFESESNEIRLYITNANFQSQEFYGWIEYTKLED